MAGESISIPILTPGADAAARNIKQVGNAAAETGGKLDFAALSLKAFNESAAKSAKADQTLVQSQKSHAKALALVGDAYRVLDGKATTTTKLMADQGRTFDNVAKTAAKAAGQNGLGALIGGGGIPGGGIGALIAAGAVLSPVLATVGTGLAGFGAAAYGVAAPILKAAQATGGLQANMAKLNPEQQKVARGLLGLGQQFAAFQKQMQPAVFTVFNEGIRLAGNLLHDVEPVATATGKALGGMLSQIDAEFQSGTWQQFFAFMARTAGPDIKLLTDNFVGLLQVLPPLIQSLQPVATTLLRDTSGLLNLVSATEKAVEAQHRFAQEASSNTGWLGKLAHAAGQAFSELVPGATGIKHVADELGRLGDNSSTSAKGLHAAALGAIQAHAPFFDLNKAVATLNNSMTTLVGNVLTLQGDNVSWRQSMQAARKQLDSNKAGLEGNSKAALANKQAVITSTNAAITFADHQLTLGKNIGQASTTIQHQITWLQGLHDKSKFVRDEIKALREEEARLNRQRINQTVNVRGLGQWSVSQSLAPGAGHRRAAGGMIPGSGNADNYPALLTPGEVVVPKPMVSAGAVDHLRGRLPGFASGGLVPSYSGSVGGVWPWIKMNDTATIRLMDQSIARATLAGMRAAQAAASIAGPAGRGTHASMPYLEGLWDAAGGPPGLAHLMAAIAMAESGGNPAAYNPSGATGLWQILGAVDPRDQPFLRNPQVNAHEAVLKWRTQGLGAWVTYTNGAYKQFYDNGGLLMPGTTVAVNNTGRPEQVIPAGRSGGRQEIVLRIEGGGNEAILTGALMQILRKAIRTHNGGNVQAALGRV